MSNKAIIETGIEIEVHAHIILKNLWEFYIMEMPDEDGIGVAYVEGFQNEIGNFSIDEIRPHILSYIENFSTDPESENYVSPPSKGRWINSI